MSAFNPSLIFVAVVTAAMGPTRLEAQPRASVKVRIGAWEGVMEETVAPLPEVAGGGVAPVAHAQPDTVPLEPRKTSSFKYFRQLGTTPEVGRLLAANGIAVDSNQGYDEFFHLYEHNRYRPLLIESHNVVIESDDVLHRTFLTSVPSVVTPDVVLHNVHLFFDFVLARAEEEHLLGEVAVLLDQLFAQSVSQQQALLGTPWESAAKDNVVFLEVARVLLHGGDKNMGGDKKGKAAPEDSWTVGVDTAEEVLQLKKRILTGLDKGLSAQLDAASQEKVKTEVRRIMEAKATLPLTIFAPPDDFKEVYSQYTPRGHYVKTTRLTAYFWAVMWLSRVPLMMSSESAVRSAALLTAAAGRSEVRARWQNIHDTVSFLAGPPDDLTLEELSPVLAKVASSGALNEDAFQSLKREWGALRAPGIQSVRTETPVGPSLASQKAFHLFSQRSVIDALVLQGLVNPQVPNKTFVRALEIPAVLGSPLAAHLLEREKLSRFEGYDNQRLRLSETLRDELQRRHARESVAGWLWTLEPLLAGAASEGPRFMQTSAYGTLRLSTYMANYAELKHDTVLYAKQALAEMGGPGTEDSEVAIDDRGYVIPEVQVYARANLLLQNLRKRLSAQKMFPAGLSESWTRFEALTSSLERISRKELANEPLTSEEYHLIKFIGGDLEHFWEETLVVRSTGDKSVLLRENNTRIIADIFEGPQGITHVASGWVHPVYVAFPRDGKMAIGRGAVLSFYEFDSPVRLSDSTWRERLQPQWGGPKSRKKPPMLPTWTRGVFTQQKTDFRRFEALEAY